jgi:hypothetical protein
MRLRSASLLALDFCVLVLDVLVILTCFSRPARADMPHNDMPHNSVSLAGLTRAAPLLDAIRDGKLDDATISAAVAANPSVKDDDVGALLGKIVSCALDRGTTLGTFPSPAPTELSGELALCGKKSAFGNWHTTHLTGNAHLGCLEAVTACVLARVNALGHRVVISVRSQSKKFPFHLEKRVPIETIYREKTPVKSLAACSPSNPAPDCGYRPQFVGHCSGGTVKVTAGTATTGIRVCRGLYGCDTSGSPAYTGVLADGKGSTQFLCPAGGGYYAVMSTTKAAVKATGHYPAPESEVCTWVEGAFYGNIFLTDRLAKVPERYRESKGSGVLAGDEHACFSPIWTDGVAQMNDRFCAGEPGCFVNSPMPCFKAVNDRCGESDPPAYGKCKPTAVPSSEPTWQLVITTYLNDPCDLASRHGECAADKVVRPEYLKYRKQQTASK